MIFYFDADFMYYEGPIGKWVKAIFGSFHALMTE